MLGSLDKVFVEFVDFCTNAAQDRKCFISVHCKSCCFDQVQGGAQLAHQRMKLVKAGEGLMQTDIVCVHGDAVNQPMSGGVFLNVKE